MPSVAIMFNVLPINCEDGFEMIYRIQGDKAVSWSCTWERLERKNAFIVAAATARVLPTEKWGNLSFPLCSALLGDGWEERWVCVGWGCSRDIPGSVLG